MKEVLDMSARTLGNKKLDFTFVEEVKDAGGGDISACYQCGTCVASCPAGMTTPYRIRKVIRKAVLGLKEDVLSGQEIWKCTTCFTCHERCPRGVNPIEVIIALRNLAIRYGYTPENFKNSLINLAATGHVVPLNQEVMEFRRELGLEDEPPTTLTSREGLLEVQKILESTKIGKKLGIK